jgi:thioredoxin reductase (NADPH)
MAHTIEKLMALSDVVLTDDHLALLAPFGTVHSTRPGDEIFPAGDPESPLVVVLSGQAGIVDRSDGNDTLLRTANAREFVGELAILTGQSSFADCLTREGGEVLVVPRSSVQEIIATIPQLGDVLVSAFAARRQLLLRASSASLTLIGPVTSPRLEQLQEFVGRNQIPHRWLSPDDPVAISVLNRLGANSEAEVWVVVRGQKLLADPTPLKVAKAIGLDLGVCPGTTVDLIVVGAGPAGLSAAVYAASEGLSTVIVDDIGIGGQAGSSSLIENYLGFPTGISGTDLAFLAEVQAVKFGSRISYPREASALSHDGDVFTLRLDDMTDLRGRAVVIATGAKYRDLGLPDQSTFQGVGLYYAATELEARRCRTDDVVVVGAGNSAGQAAMFLSRSVSNVHLICRGPNLERTMSQYLISRLERTANVRIHTGSVVQRIAGGEQLEKVTVRTSSGEDMVIDACALFIMIGAEPRTDWLRGMLELDDHGFILTGADLGPNPSGMIPFQTSHPGVFAVGDVRSGSIKRVASAVGEGAVVVNAVHRYLASRQGAPEAVAANR